MALKALTVHCTSESVAKHFPLRKFFNSGKSSKSLGAKSKENFAKGGNCPMESGL